MRQFKIGERVITDDSPTYVIAEIGHNHQGKEDVCMKMVAEAKEAGADAVKLQRIDAKELFTQAAYNEAYNSENAFGPTYGKHREALTLSDNAFRRVIDYCHDIDIDFICTAFEEKSADVLYDAGCRIFKLASFHLSDFVLASHIIKYNVPIIVSTGGSRIYDVNETVKYFMEKGNTNIALLQCTSEYPVFDESKINLGVIKKYRELFPSLVVGYSHHHPSITACSDAYHFGARILEVHFTLNRASKGTDQSFSVEPSGLKAIVRGLKEARAFSGESKCIYTEERKPLSKMSRSIYVKQDLKRGDKITTDVLEYKAPFAYLSTKYVDSVLNLGVIKDVKAGEPLQWNHIMEVENEPTV